MERQFTRHDDPLLESIVADLYERTIDVRHLAAKGYLITSTKAKVPFGLPPGDDDQVLIADSAEVAGVRWGGVTSVPVDHGSLTGLLDDDHTQYALNTHSFVTLTADSRLTVERVLAVGGGLLTLTDNGAGSTVVIGLANSSIDHGNLSGLSDDDHSQYALTTHAFVTIGNTARLTGERALTAGTGITITDGGANGAVTISGTASTTEPYGRLFAFMGA